MVPHLAYSISALKTVNGHEMRPRNGPAVGLLKTPLRELATRLRMYTATGLWWARNGLAMGPRSARHGICNVILQWELLNPKQFLQWSCNGLAMGLQWGSNRFAMRSAMGYRDGSLFARGDSCNGPAMGLQWGPPTSSPNRKGTLHNPIAGPIAGPLQAHCKPIARPLQELRWI